jgi:hypothetical protein
MVKDPIFRPGQRCGDFYDITAGLSAEPGAMAESYLAIHRSTRERVIVTCSRFAHVEGDLPSAEAFRARVEKLRALAIDNIAKIYDHGVHDGVYWVASQVIDDPTVVEMHLQRKDKSPEWFVLDSLAVALRVCTILEAASEMDAHHGSLRPACILIRGLPSDCDPFLLEMGHAEIFMLTPSAARATPRYRPPEQLTGGALDARSDIYSLGMCMYHLIANAPPYADEAPASEPVRLQALVLREMPPALTKAAYCPEAVWRLVERAIAKDPLKRFQSWEELTAELEAVITRVLNEGPMAAFVRDQERQLAENTRAHEARRRARGAPLDGSREPTTIPPGPDTRRRILAALRNARATVARRAVGVRGAEPPAALEPEPAPVRTPRNTALQHRDRDSKPVTLPSRQLTVVGVQHGAPRDLLGARRARVAAVALAVLAGAAIGFAAFTHYSEPIAVARPAALPILVVPPVALEPAEPIRLHAPPTTSPPSSAAPPAIAPVRRVESPIAIPSAEPTIPGDKDRCSDAGYVCIGAE